MPIKRKKWLSLLCIQCYRPKDRLNPSVGLTNQPESIDTIQSASWAGIRWFTLTFLTEYLQICVPSSLKCTSIPYHSLQFLFLLRSPDGLVVTWTLINSENGILISTTASLVLCINNHKPIENEIHRAC